jgi:hypothetical protein
MVFKITSCVPSDRRGARAFTIVEYMVAMSIGLAVLASALLMWTFASRTCAMLLHYVDMSNASKVALDRMSQQIRNAVTVESCAANKMVLVLPGTNNAKVTFTYDSGALTLKQTKTSSSAAAATTTLLTQCSNFTFVVYQRTPQANSFELYTNAFATNTAKVVQMKWVCFRKLRGDYQMLESQVAANVVMRNPRATP